MKIITGENNVFGIIATDITGQPQWLFRAKVTPWVLLTCENPGGRDTTQNSRTYAADEILAPKNTMPETTQDTIACKAIVADKDGRVEVTVERTTPEGKVSSLKIVVQESAMEIMGTINEMSAIMEKKDYLKQAPQTPEFYVVKNPQRVVTEISGNTIR
ncbi:MAG: hypothetical protein WC464_01230 [Bdellovibrionales bacterium]